MSSAKRLRRCSRGLLVGVLSLWIGMSWPYQLTAETNAGLLFLSISPSPSANGAGNCYSLNFNTDPMAIFKNPASLGFLASRCQASAAFYPQKIQWLPQFTESLTYDAQVYMTGLNFQPILKIPCALGFSYQRIDFDLGGQFLTNETSPEPIGVFHAYNKANGFSTALAFYYYLHLSIGYAHKWMESQLGPLIQENTWHDVKANPSAYDWGVILELPVFDLISKQHPAACLFAGRLQPRLDLSTFYAHTNHGDRVIYIDASQADPLPRTVHTGVNLHLGLEYRGAQSATQLLGFKWAREAEDLLVAYQPSGHWAYRSGFGDIEFLKHILGNQSNPAAISKQGWQLELAECLYLRGGTYDDLENQICYQTQGWGINWMQPVRWLNGSGAIRLNHWALRLLLGLDVEYHVSSLEIAANHPLAGTKFKGLVLRFNLL
ncbi:hypothetical protein L0128_16820 [candidate division KSB1 bacterium]|nr:hypothetical protein [candidate division KSB1 bacterium]